MKTGIIATLAAALLLSACATHTVQNSTELPTPTSDVKDGWVQLFDGKDFTGTKLTIRFPQDIRKLEDMPSDEGINGFEDKTSSVRWSIPEGYSFILYENPIFTGEQTELKGNGEIQEINDLDKHNKRENQASSGRWLRNDQK